MLVRCWLSETLEVLSMKKEAGEAGTTKVFHIEDITVYADFSAEMRRSLMESGVNGRVYGFRIHTTEKSFELGCDELDTRDKWTETLQTLKKAYTDLHKPDGLRRYFTVFTSSQPSFSLLSPKKPSKNTIKTEIRELQEELETVNSEIATLVLQDVILKVEIQEEKRKLGSLNEDLRRLVEFYQWEIGELEEELRVCREKEEVKRRGERRGRKLRLAQVYRCVLPYFTFGEVMHLRVLSPLWNHTIQGEIRGAKYWKELSPRGFSPRAGSWYVYCQIFTKEELAEQKSTLTGDEKQQIHGDVQRCDFSVSVEALLTALCAKHPEVGYCQGMHLTTQFLRSVLLDDSRTFFVMCRLMNSPYYLSEVWKSGLPRLKLAIFQLDSLLRLKLPKLHYHFLTIEIPIEVIAAPWILTLFTQLVRKYIDADTGEGTASDLGLVYCEGMDFCACVLLGVDEAV